MATARDVIRRSLRLIGAYKPGEPIEDDEAQDALTALKGMIDTWASERLTCSVINIPEITLTSGALSYTVGPGGDFDIARPVWLLGVSCVDPANPAQPAEYPAEMLNYQQWQRIPQKNVGSRLFTQAYYQSDFPLGRIYIWPFVNAGGIGMRLYVPVAITGYEDLNTDYFFPPGYEEAIIYNLCLRLGPEWGLEVPGHVVDGASRFLANIKRTNVTPELLGIDRALLNNGDGYYNWRNDQPVGGGR